MIQWALKHILWLGIRLTITLACISTVQHVIHEEGYRVELKSLLVSAVCLIVLIQFWAPRNTNKET